MIHRHKKHKRHKRKTPVAFLLFVLFVPFAAVPLFAAPTTLPIPNVVNLKELVNLYDPVPFDHKSHAQMAAMWDGCQTCHHRTPVASTRPAPATHTQNDSAQIPACKSCHEISAKETDLHKPSLKGAYHRQCLNCHKEWMHDNACTICHKARPGTEGAGVATTQPPPTKDDIVGRMHPPIKEPEIKIYRARYTPVAGPNVIFHHAEHVKTLGLKCVNCHHRDTCSNCHDSATNAATTRPTPLHPGATWRASHEPCVGCHPQKNCSHCHYQDGASSPLFFQPATLPAATKPAPRLATTHPALRPTTKPVAIIRRIREAREDMP